MKLDTRTKAALLCTVFAVAGLTACGKKEEATATAEPAQVTVAIQEQQQPAAAPKAAEADVDPFSPKAKSDARHKASLAAYKATMAKVDADRAAGKLNDEQYTQAKFEATLKKATDDADPTTYSNGSRRGTVYKFSIKASDKYNEGALLDECKSGEGEMQLEATTTDNTVTGTGSVSDVFKFSVSKNDKKLLDALRQAVENKHVVVLTYDQAFETNKCEFKTDYRIVGVQDVTVKQTAEQIQREARKRALDQSALDRAAERALAKKAAAAASGVKP